MRNKKPFVSAAAICESVLQDKDGVVSLIRIVDRFTLRIVPLPPGEVPTLQLRAFFGVKSGDVKGRSELSVKLRKPDGNTVQLPQKFPIVLNGEEHGANLTLTFGMPVIFGLYWLDLYWNDEMLTSAPFRLVAETPDQESPAQKS